MNCKQPKTSQTGSLLYNNQADNDQLYKIVEYLYSFRAFSVPYLMQLGHKDKWQTFLRAFFPAFLWAKREMCGLKIHLPPWYWLAAEMSINFARPMKLSFLSARITSTFGLQPALQIYTFLSFSQPLKGDGVVPDSLLTIISYHIIYLSLPSDFRVAWCS